MPTAFATHRIRAGIARVAVIILIAVAAPSSAFVVNSYTSDGQLLYLKWGTDNHDGTSGGTVYWSFIPAGTSGSGFCGDDCPGTSGDSIQMEISPGGGFAPVTLTSLESDITAMMAEWSMATGISFVEVSDSGVPINDPTAVPPDTGQIRIGVFAFSNNQGEAAVGYSPPPNGGTGAGNILFNSNDFYQNYNLAEGTPYDQTYAPNDFQGLTLHEFGHAIGLEHPPYDGTCPVMCVDPRCLGVIKRELGADDINGANFLYNPEIFANGFD